jgi:hypothetical protein
MTVEIIHGDARSLPLEDGSVDLVCTSPPYWSLRSYQDNGEHYEGQIGAEATPGEYIDALLECTREWMRVLKPSGSLWLNLGDKYGPGKSLLGLPWEYALRARRELGLILRAEVIWSKCLSGGAQVYARVNGREKVIAVKDLARCVPGSVELWTGEKWSAMLRCDPTPPTQGRSASSAAARQARYRGKPIPKLAADLEIEFRSGERIGCTPNHKWPTSRGLVRADELVEGDVVPSVKLAAGEAQPSGLDDEMTGWLVGLYIAEGSRSEDMVQIASHIREVDRFERLQQIADAFDGRFACYHTGGNAATASLSGKVIRAILDTYVGGRVAKDKRLAPACWRRSDVFIRAVLEGYLSGDGHYEAKTDRWVLGFTANDGLATDLRAVAARLGHSIRLRRTVHRFDGREFPGWSGTLYLDPTRRKRPDGEIVAIRQSRARMFWNIEIADEPHQFALASGLLTCNSNGLPESVTDRVRRSHEQWFHFTVQPRYFSAVDEIREAYSENTHARRRDGLATPDVARKIQEGHWRAGNARLGGKPNLDHPLGKLPGSVWEVATQPLKVPAGLGVSHFAAFPVEWPLRIIRGWSPIGICTECEDGRRPVAQPARLSLEGERLAARRNSGDTYSAIPRGGGDAGISHHQKLSETERERLMIPAAITGYACACPEPTAPTRPAVVLDPFGGTGTTALAADVLGRHGISVDASADYCRIAQWRTTDPGERARAMGVEKPKPEMEGQMSLFDLEMT